MLDLWLLIVFGFLIGILASMVGVGGGVFIVPILTFFYSSLFPHVNQATGTSLTVIIFTALASTINYWRQRRIYYKTGLILVVTTAPGAYIGSYLAKITKDQLLGLVFGAFLILAAIRMIMSIIRKKSDDKAIGARTVARSDNEIISSRRTIIIGIGLGFFAGLASGLLGIGGGTLIVPIMVFALGMPIHLATATSMFTMIFTAISGVAEYYQANLVNFEVALLFAAGTVIGAQVGAYASRKFSARNLSILFALILMVAGINMIIKYW
jgi:uncharacterized membrane protein YfcA